MTCTVELFGVARMVAGTPELTLTVPPDATIANVFQSLAEKLPALAGRVVNATGGGLRDGYACNVNGLEFVRDLSSRLNDGDRIVLLSADAGG
jgi:molybdopterin converting factor small subunit